MAEQENLYNYGYGSDNLSAQIIRTDYVEKKDFDNAIEDIVNGASSDYDTLGEVEGKIKDNAAADETLGERVEAISTDLYGKEGEEGEEDTPAVFATKEEVSTAVSDIVGGASENYNTLGKIEAILETPTNVMVTVSTTATKAPTGTNAKFKAALEAGKVAILILQTTGGYKYIHYCYGGKDTLEFIGVSNDSALQFQFIYVDSSDNITKHTKRPTNVTNTEA